MNNQAQIGLTFLFIVHINIDVPYTVKSRLNKAHLMFIHIITKCHVHFYKFSSHLLFKRAVLQNANLVF